MGTFLAAVRTASHKAAFSMQTICIHGLGAAINRAIMLALQLQQRYSDTLTVRDSHLFSEVMLMFPADFHEHIYGSSH